MTREGTMRYLSAIAVTVLLSVSCGTGVETGSSDILSVMPGGHDYYLMFDPQGIGLPRILEVAAGFIQPGRHQQIIENMGFDPMDWGEWESRLSIEQGRDMGVVIDRGSHDVSMIAFYLPGADAEATEVFFNDLMIESGDFRGVLEYIEADGYVIVVMAESEQVSTGFDPGAPSLAESDHLFEDLSRDDYISSPDATLYMRTFGEDEEFLRSLLVELKIDRDVLRVRFCIAFDDPEMNRFAAVFSDPEGSGFRIPGVSSGVLAVSLNVEELLNIIMDAVAPGELDSGIQEMGFSSFADFFFSFSGDICISYCDQPPYTASVQLGLEDPDAISAFLGLLAAEDPDVGTQELDGTEYYWMHSTGIPGVERIEYGVFDNVLYICSGCHIEDALEGRPLEEYIEEFDLGVGGDHSIVLSSSLVIMKQAAEAGILSINSDLLPDFERVAGYLDVDGGIVSIGLALETDGVSPMDLLMEYLGILGGEM
jgi:hypothetical protein